jgi:hypothetical protein
LKPSHKKDIEKIRLDFMKNKFYFDIGISVLVVTVKGGCGKTFFALKGIGYGLHH